MIDPSSRMAECGWFRGAASMRRIRPRTAHWPAPDKQPTTSAARCRSGRCRCAGSCPGRWPDPGTGSRCRGGFSPDRGLAGQEGPARLRMKHFPVGAMALTSSSSGLRVNEYMKAFCPRRRPATLHRDQVRRHRGTDLVALGVEEVQGDDLVLEQIVVELHLLPHGSAVGTLGKFCRWMRCRANCDCVGFARSPPRRRRARGFSPGKRGRSGERCQRRPT